MEAVKRIIMEKFIRDEIPLDVKKIILQLLKEKGISDDTYRRLGAYHSISSLFEYIQNNFYELSREKSEKLKKKLTTQQMFEKTKKLLDCDNLKPDRFSEPQVDCLIMDIDENYPELMKEFIMKNHSDFVLDVLNYPKGLIPENIDEEAKLELIAENYKNFNWFQLKEKLSN